MATETFDKAIAGRFRANPNASQHNALNLLDPDTPGTPQEDSGTIDTTSGTEFTGISYTGKDGVQRDILFTKEEFPDGGATQYKVLVSEGRDALRWALLKLLEKHEVGCIVEVTGATVNFDVVHIGSGTVHGVYMDGSLEALSRGAISALAAAAPTAAPTKVLKVGGKKAAAKKKS